MKVMETFLAALTEHHGEHHRPIHCYSQQLDSVAKELLPCMREQTAEIVVDSPLTMYVPHSFGSWLNSTHTQQYSAILSQPTSSLQSTPTFCA